MIRKFLKDTRGNYALLTVAAMVPIMGAVALAVDYAEVLRQREAVRNALDAAGMATARRTLEGANEEQLKTYAQDFFNANLAGIKPSNAPLTVTLPNNSYGGGTLELQATLKYEPYFLPVAAALLGKSSNDIDLSFVVKSGIRLKNTLEVALVLDNSGSMSNKGTGSGQKRIDLLKAASKQLVETLATQAALMKQIEKPVQFAVVPFSASVNVGPTNDDKPWMDTLGLSPVHHENFDWSTMTSAYLSANSPTIGNRYVEFTGGIWRKRGTAWGDTQDQPLTRFSLYQDIAAVTGRERLIGNTHYVCYRKKANSEVCDLGGYETNYNGTYTRFSSWQGCVEARPSPYDSNDEPASTSTPATLFVPSFAPDEPGDRWLDFDNNGKDDWKGTTYSYSNSWWTDWNWNGGGTAKTRQSDMRKYYRAKPKGSSSTSSQNGPSASCTTTPITPLQDVTKTAGKKAIDDAIDAMTPTGNTNVPEGTAWGWRVLSSGAPFTEGRSDGEKGNDKIIIVLTDGANTYGSPPSSDPADNKSTYAAYGYVGQKYNGSGSTRLYMNTSAKDFQSAMDDKLQKICANAKGSKPRNDKGQGTDNVMIMTVTLDLGSRSDELKAIQALSDCASYSRTTPGKKLTWNASGGNLMTVFKEIADELSNLRIVN